MTVGHADNKTARELTVGLRQKGRIKISRVSDNIATGRSYREFLAHPTAQYQMTFLMWEKQRKSKYQARRKSPIKETAENQRKENHAWREAFGYYLKPTDLKNDPVIDATLMLVADRLYEHAAWRFPGRNRYTKWLSQLKRDLIRGRCSKLEDRLLVVAEFDLALNKKIKHHKIKLESTNPKTQIKAQLHQQHYDTYKLLHATPAKQLAQWLKKD